MMRELGKYAETASKDDMTTFLKSGFRAASTVKTATPPLWQWIRGIMPGKSVVRFASSLWPSTVRTLTKCV